MASLSSAKTLGGVGGILVFIPGVSLVGWILILLATKEISETLNDKTIFDDALLGAITAVIGAVIFGVLVFSGSFFAAFAFGAFALLIPFLVALGVFWIFTIISATFLKRSYEKIGQRLNVSAFATAGSLYLIGAALTIVLVGFLIIFIALIFQVVAYWSIEDRPQSPGWAPPGPQGSTASSATQPTATSQQVAADYKFCPKCGAKLPNAAVFCTSCGAKQS